MTTSTPTTKTTKSTKPPSMKANTTQHPLAVRLLDLSTSAEDLGLAVAAQAARNANLALLRASESEVLAAVAAETLDFKEGAAALTENRGEQDALGHAIELRAGELVASANGVLSSSLELKESTLSALHAAAGHLASQRQGEVVALLGGWGGAAELLDPMPMGLVSASCKKVQAIQALAAGVEAWAPSLGFRALMDALQPAVAAVAEVGAPEAPAAIFGGFVENQRASIYGWRDCELRKVLIHEGPVAAARELYADLQSRPGHLGFARVEFFLAHSEHVVVFQNHTGRGCDARDLSAMQTGSDHDGKSAGFLTKTAAWLS